MALNATKKWNAKKGSGTPQYSGLLFGSFVAIGILFAAITMMALLISKNKMQIENSAGIVKLVYAAAIFFGCFLTTRKAKQKKMLLAAMTLVLFCVVVLGSICAFPAAPASSVGAFLGVSAAAGMLGAFLGARRKRRSYE